MAKLTAETRQAIEYAAREFNVPADVLYGIAKQESNFKTNAKALTSSATGLFQHVTDTWNSLAETYGGRYGITPQTSRKDPVANALMAAALMAENQRALTANGIPITPGSLYMAHFAGLPTALEVFEAPDAAKVSSVLSAEQRQANGFLGNWSVGDLKDWTQGKISKYADQYYQSTPANMNRTGIGWSGTIDSNRIDDQQGAYTPRDQYGNLAAIPSPRPDPNAYPETPRSFPPMPDIMQAPGGLFDYTREAALMQPGFDPMEAGRNLEASLSMDMSGTEPAPAPMPNITQAPGGLLGEYQRAQYQPASGSAWQNQPTVNERMASPRDYTMEQQRQQQAIVDATRSPVGTPANMGAAGYGLSAPAPSMFANTGAFNNIAQTQPTGQFTPTSPFGRDLAPAAPMSAPSGAVAWGQNQSPGVRSGTTAWTGPGSTPQASVTAIAEDRATREPNLGVRDAIDLPASAPANLAATYGTAIGDPRLSMAAPTGLPAAPQTATTATQAMPAAPPALTAPSRSVPERVVTPYSPPTTVAPREAKPQYTPNDGMVEIAPGVFMPGYITPDMYSDTPKASSKNYPMGATINPNTGKVNGYMPNVPGNPAQVMRDQAKLIAANPLEAIGRMVVGALQGGVFGPGLSGIRMASGGLFGAPTYGAHAPTRQSIGYGLTAPGGIGGLGGGDRYSGRTPGDRAISSAFQSGGIFGGTSTRNPDGSWAGNTGSQATPI
jgi:hypothetical protein